MKQVNIRLPAEEFELLELISKTENMAITSLFKQIINPSFKEWKMNKIMDLYATGTLRFKEAARLSNMSLSEFLIFLSKSNIDPIYVEEAERRSEQIALSITKTQLFKNPNFIRRSKEKD